MLKIGITEQGDAGLDVSWYDKLHTVDGAILITKNLTKNCQDHILKAINNGHKLILHLGCTGWGKSPVEPNVPIYTEQIDACMELIQNGFPIQNVVLRIDPIIPTDSGLQAVQNVIEYAFQTHLLPQARVRISILDEYKHVKERLRNAGYAPFYPSSNFQASPNELRAVSETLEKYDLQYHTCAETRLTSKEGIYVQSGCVSPIDLRIMGIPLPEHMNTNPQNRYGCKCLSCKTELLTHKAQCPHGCLYCYWKPNFTPQKKDA